jgi:hypothetical protein
MPLDRHPAEAGLDGALINGALWVAAAEAGPGCLLARAASGAAVTLRRAASCLLEPAPGDVVLLHGGGPVAFVLAILTRAEGQDAVLAAPAGARLVLRAPEVAIEAGARLSATAPEAALALGRVTLRARSAALVADAATLAAGLLRSTARQIEQQAERLLAVAGSRTVRVRGADLLQAGSSLATVETVAATRSGTTLLTARHDVRVDAERVAIG